MNPQRKKKRYFIIAYRATKGNSILVGDFTHTGNEFPNRESIVRWLERASVGFSNVVFTSVIELNATDFKNWDKKH